MFDLPDKADNSSRSDYVSMNEAYRIAHEATTKSAAKAKKNYDGALHSRDCSSLETETFPPSIFPL
jgi:hypothetical protein